MADYKLDNDVRTVLERSTITGNLLVLPEGQLDRKLYERVNKALVLAGGKWTKGKGHVFASDPRAKLGLILETGVAVDGKKLLQAFYTPPELARRVVEKACVTGGSVLEPSAGGGALLMEIGRQRAHHSYFVELDPAAAQALSAKGYEGTCRDFLSIDPAGPMYSNVVMNPPFTKNQDIKHVEHALKFLAPGGRLVAIMSANTARPAFQRLVAGLNHEIEEIDAGAFKSSGTNVRTILLTVVKR